MKLTFKLSGVQKLQSRFSELSRTFSTDLDSIVLAAAKVVEQEAKRLAPVKTGALRRSIKATVVRKGQTQATAEVSTNLKYAKWIEEGVGSFVIEPKNKKALYWKGAAHPVKYVRHPGIKPQPFMRPALDLGRERAKQAAEAVVRVALEPYR